MKTKLPLLFIVLALFARVHQATAQGTAFTYQGNLNAGGSPANGLYDFRFKLYADPLGDTQVGANYFTNGVVVTGGIFTTTINFGVGLFNGSNYWLEVDVRTNNPANMLAYQALSPLQALTPAPYAVFANTASNVSGMISTAQITGAVASANLSGTYGNILALTNTGNSFTGSFSGNFSGNGANIANVNAASLNGLNATNFWQLGGNNVSAGQIFGSTNNQAVTVMVGNQRALMITTNLADSANFIGGAPVNVVDAGVDGAVIAGGGTTNFLSQNSPNHISSSFASIGGGSGNWVQTNSDHSFIGAGWNNLIGNNAYQSVLAGGWYNTNLANSSVIGGGNENVIQSGAIDSVIAGGQYNTINFVTFVTQEDPVDYDTNTYGYSTIAGGYYNIAANVMATVGGGYNNTASGVGSVIAGGGGSFTYDDFDGPSFNGLGSIANGDWSSIGGGYNNTASGPYSSIIGGYQNVVTGQNGTVSGGQNNTNNGDGSVIAGGAFNYIPTGSPQPAIGGGYNNLATNSYATIPGGANNVAGGQYSFAAGQQAQATNQGSFVWADSLNAPFASTVNDSFNVRARGGARFVTSGAGLTVDGQNVLTGAGSFNGFNLTNLNAAQLSGLIPTSVLPGFQGNDNAIGGGTGNTINGSDSVISGGQSNTNNANGSSIGGGAGNLIQTGAYYSLIGSGSGNIIGTNSDTSVIAGGYHNYIQANSPGSFIGAGQNNLVTNNAIYCVIGGGSGNTNTGPYSTIPGGENNIAGTNCFAAGSSAQAANTGSFVWSDNSGTVTKSFANNQFMARASGGVVLLSSTAASPTSYATGSAGVALEPNTTAWSTVSDRNAKKNFQPVNTEEVLDKLAAIPIQQWNYKWESDIDVPNIGPMAQDFKHAFFPGRDDKSISTLEFDGVELAAIQGLNKKLNEKDAEVRQLKQSVDELKKLVQALAEKK